MSTIEEKFKEFTNEVFCRRATNQYIASAIWKTHIVEKLPIEIKNTFQVEWAHYKNGTIDYRQFGAELKGIEKILLEDGQAKSTEKKRG